MGTGAYSHTTDLRTQKWGSLCQFRLMIGGWIFWDLSSDNNACSARADFRDGLLIGYVFVPSNTAYGIRRALQRSGKRSFNEDCQLMRLFREHYEGFT